MYGMYDEKWYQDDECKHCLHPNGYQDSQQNPYFHHICCKCGKTRLMNLVNVPLCGAVIPMRKWYKGGDNE